MNRFDGERPLRVAYVVGTFSAHPVVMGAMNEFLRWVVQPSTAALYGEADRRCEQWARQTNLRRARTSLPVASCDSRRWTVLFTEPSRFNWLLQHDLRAEGVTR
jgi:glutamate-1-semialdehyde 2,1-aminomutase